MDTFSLIRNALAASENDPDKVGLHADVVETGRIVAAVQVVVDAFTPPDGGRYIVAFRNITTAQTHLGERTISVSSKPLRDPSLTLVEKAVIVATFVMHEIGHTYVSKPRGNVVRDHNPHSGFHSVANLADDIILEPFMADRLPILQDAFEFTGAWVLRNTMKDLPVTYTLNKGTTAAQRFNIILGATRYGDIPELIWADDKMIAERDWSRAWADRLIALPLTDHAGFIALCDEAWERCRMRDRDPIIDDEPEPEPPVDEPVDEPEPDDEGEPEPVDEGGDDVTEDEPKPDDTTCGPTVPSDKPGEGEPEEDQPVGDDFDEQDDEDKDEPTDEAGEDEPEDDLRDEDDFDQSEVDQTTHDSAEQHEPAVDSDVEKQVRVYSSTTVTAFGRHGHMSTRWD